jgi:hypothetical protein
MTNPHSQSHIILIVVKIIATHAKRQQKAPQQQLQSNHQLKAPHFVLSHPRHPRCLLPLPALPLAMPSHPHITPSYNIIPKRPDLEPHRHWQDPLLAGRISISPQGPEAKVHKDLLPHSYPLTNQSSRRRDQENLL